MTCIILFSWNIHHCHHGRKYDLTLVKMWTETKRKSQRCNIIDVDLCVWHLFINIAAGWAFLPPPSCVRICWRRWKEDGQWCESVWENTTRTFVVVINVTKISVLEYRCRYISWHWFTYHQVKWIFAFYLSMHHDILGVLVFLPYVL